MNHAPNLPIDLGDGLVLRRGSAHYSERLSDFNARVHSDDGWDKPDEPLRTWVMDMASGTHPTFRVCDFTLVEDTRRDMIVSSLSLISQSWSYEGIPFPAGQPELVGTHPEYRRRGLIRAQFDVVHRWSAERGQLVQGIVGIPWYYRQFGYEMALDCGGGRGGYEPNIPKLKENETEPYRVRQATGADL